MSNASIDALVNHSQFVFAGVVERLGTTTEAVPATANAVVVRVNKIFHGPEELRGFTGKEIIVRVTQSSGTISGERAVFFATSWSYGETLAVIEVGRVADGDQATIQNDIEDAYRRLADDRLLQRIALAELVIAGKVVRTEPADRAARRRPASEHAPDWWEAVVEVEFVEKGRLEQRTVSVLFPKSLDETWIKSPKFAVGDEGIWILQRDQKERGSPALRTAGLTALDPLDHMPRNEVNRIRALMKRD
jgi:hypothetical protein